jgi:hypothetical protein
MDKTPIEQLHGGELPTMVNWYDPRLLTRIGVRTIISSVFGQYADQRLIQAATDQASVAELVSRYDFSNPYADDLQRRLRMDDNGAFWVDYMADTGDGFESTYAMAYLLAKSSLTVPRAGELWAGDILVMGGDQCYPQATREDYKKRLQTPFNWAYNVPKPERKLFAIPGNHDWYDGLSAFDSLFCGARDKLSVTQGNRIGGWQPQQHRSYWAIKLPYNWWIWGADIQFSKYLDASQVNYFTTIANQMGKDDKLILCLAEPAWMIAEAQGQDEEENFFKITAIARARGIRICAIVAGDWHHYARYYQPDLDVHFFTAGGGGAFLHPTHGLKNEITVRWPEHSEGGASTRAAMDPQTSGWTAEQYDIGLRGQGKSSDPPATVGSVLRDAVGPRQALRQQDAKVYPSKGTSLLLSLKNLVFPFMNPSFGIGLGLIYWIITWQYYSVVSQHDVSAGKIDYVSSATYLSVLARMPLYLMQGMLVSIPFVLMLVGMYVVLVSYVEAVERPKWRRWLVKFTVGTAHFLAHVVAMFSIGLALVMFHNMIAPSIEKQVEDLWRTRGDRNVIVREVLQETLEPLSQERAEQRDAHQRRRGADERDLGRRQLPPPQALPGGVQQAPPSPSRSAPAADQRVAYSEVRQLIGLVLYPLEMILIGGFVGGFIWGLYWVLSGLAFRMHAEDAFAALRIRDYKNFLRFKFEPNQVTIYPLGIDKIPRAAHWMAPPDGQPAQPHNPQLVPTAPIDVQLIERPIVIAASREQKKGR